MDKTNKQIKRKRVLCELPEEAIKILEVVKKNVKEFTWGAEEISNVKAMKIWARRTIQSGLYKV